MAFAYFSGLTANWKGQHHLATIKKYSEKSYKVDFAGMDNTLRELKLIYEERLAINGFQWLFANPKT